MQKKEINIKKCLAMFSLCLLTPLFAFAQEAPLANNDQKAITQIIQETPVVVATVNIHNPQIISQSQNNFKLSAEFSNRVGSQPQIKYAINLIKRMGESGAGSVVDTKIYSDTFSLSENDSVIKEIEYQAPVYLNGKYNIWIVSENESGLPLAKADFGEVTVEGDNQSLEIALPSCYLEVKGEEKKYLPMQGVDVAQTENLVAHCDVTNNFKENKEFTYNLETFRRSFFGEKMATSQNNEKLSLLPGEIKSFYFNLPANLPPQSYSTQLTMVDNQGEAISNQVAFHYVIRGISGTIQNLTLDKNYYTKDDLAQLSFFWTGSADNFPGSRVRVNSANEKVIVEGVITDYQNDNCSQDFSDNLTEGGEVNQKITVPIIKDCQNPVVSINLKDQQGNVLDKATFQLTSDIQESNQSKYETRQIPWVKYLSWLFAALAIAVIGFVLIKKYLKKKNNIIGLLIFSVALGGMLFGGTGQAKADTFAISHFITTINIDKSAYDQGELAQASADVIWAECDNFVPQVLIDVAINGVNENIINTVMASDGEVSASKEIAVQSTPGSYAAAFTFKGSILYDWVDDPSNPDGYYDAGAKVFVANYSIPYTVIASSLPNPTCSISWGFSPISTGETGHMTMSVFNDTDNTATCHCTGLDAGTGTDYTFAASTYSDGPFATAGTKDCVCTVSNTSATNTCSGSLDVSSIIVDGACGSRDTTYTLSDTDFPVGSTLCGSGTATPTTIVFPPVNSSVSWTCSASGGGTPDNCTATHADCTPTYSAPICYYDSATTCNSSNCGQSITDSIAHCRKDPINSCGSTVSLSLSDCIDCSNTTITCPACLWKESTP